MTARGCMINMQGKAEAVVMTASVFFVAKIVELWYNINYLEHGM